MSDISPKNANSWHIADNPATFEPARTNNFEFVITGIDSLLKAGVSEADAQDSDYIVNGQEIVRLSVNKASVPHFSQGEISVSRGNTKSYYAGTMEVSDGTLEVVDYIGASGKSVLMAWQRLSGNLAEGLVGRAVNYKKECILIEYTPDYEKVRSWRLLGCWVKGLSEGEYNQESSDKKVVTATIRYDRAIPME